LDLVKQIKKRKGAAGLKGISIECGRQFSVFLQ
jgi:hypothetical protein